MATLAERQRDYRQALAGIYDAAEARHITRWVIEEVMQIKSVHLVMDRFLILTTDQEEVFDRYLQRLLQHEPVQYVLGYAEFYGLRFKVDRSVLIPRPETEELVEWVLSETKHPTPSIIDIGTGSGCIPITLKANLPDAKIEAIDISIDALGIARENARLNHVDVIFHQMDILHKVPASKYDLIISNPPYIGHEEKNVMADNVLKFEPHIALFVDDPLIFYRRIAHLAPRMLNDDGSVYLEVSECRAGAVADIYMQAGFDTLIKKDLSGRDRMVKATIS